MPPSLNPASPLPLQDGALPEDRRKSSVIRTKSITLLAQNHHFADLPESPSKHAKSPSKTHFSESELTSKTDDSQPKPANHGSRGQGSSNRGHHLFSIMTTASRGNRPRQESVYSAATTRIMRLLQAFLGESSSQPFSCCSVTFSELS